MGEFKASDWVDQAIAAGMKPKLCHEGHGIKSVQWVIHCTVRCKMPNAPSDDEMKLVVAELEGRGMVIRFTGDRHA